MNSSMIEATDAWRRDATTDSMNLLRGQPATCSIAM